MRNTPDQEDVVIYDSSLTLSQLKGLWGNNGDFSQEELESEAQIKQLPRNSEFQTITDEAQPLAYSY